MVNDGEVKNEGAILQGMRAVRIKPKVLFFGYINPFSANDRVCPPATMK